MESGTDSVATTPSGSETGILNPWPLKASGLDRAHNLPPTRIKGPIWAFDAGGPARRDRTACLHSTSTTWSVAFASAADGNRAVSLSLSDTTMTATTITMAIAMTTPNHAMGDISVSYPTRESRWRGRRPAGSRCLNADSILGFSRRGGPVIAAGSEDPVGWRLSADISTRRVRQHDRCRSRGLVARSSRSRGFAAERAPESSLISPASVLDCCEEPGRLARDRVEDLVGALRRHAEQLRGLYPGIHDCCLRSRRFSRRRTVLRRRRIPHFDIFADADQQASALADIRRLKRADVTAAVVMLTRTTVHTTGTCTGMRNDGSVPGFRACLRYSCRPCSNSFAPTSSDTAARSLPTSRRGFRTVSSTADVSSCRRSVRRWTAADQPRHIAAAPAAAARPERWQLRRLRRETSGRGRVRRGRCSC